MSEEGGAGKDLKELARGANDNTPPEDSSAQSQKVQQAIRKISDQTPNELMGITAMMGSMSSSPIQQKMNEEHITQVLTIAANHDEREYKLRDKAISIGASNRWFYLAAGGMFVVVILVIIVCFRDKPEVISHLLTGIFSFISGGVGGWGIANRSNSIRDEE